MSHIQTNMGSFIMDMLGVCAYQDRHDDVCHLRGAPDGRLVDDGVVMSTAPRLHGVRTERGAYIVQPGARTRPDEQYCRGRQEPEA
ncbi:hypothetical protein PTKU46_79660 [Paraburkholderia terrae]